MLMNVHTNLAKNVYSKLPGMGIFDFQATECVNTVTISCNCVTDVS